MHILKIICLERKSIYLFMFKVYLFILRKRGRRAERTRERIPSRFCAVSTEPNTGLHPTNREIMTRTEIKSWMLILLSHAGAPI